MSFGVSVSDIALGIKGCKWIWDANFDKNNAADERYKQLGNDVKLLEARLQQLMPALENALLRYEDPDLDAVDLTGDLKNLVGDFQQTLDRCQEILIKHVSLRRSRAGVIQNVIWATTAQEKVDQLRRDIQFHTQKIYLVMEPVTLGLLTTIDAKMDEMLQMMRAHFSIQTPLPAIPEWLDLRFQDAIQIDPPENFSNIIQVPLKEGFDALYSHFRESTYAFRDPETADQTIEQYLNLLKAQWLLETLRKGSILKKARPGSLYPRTLAQIEQRIMNQHDRNDIVRFTDEQLQSLNSTAFLIWPPVAQAPARVITDANIGEEEILKVSVQVPSGNEKGNLVLFKTGPTTLRIVKSAVSISGAPYYESERFNTHIDRFIPFYAIRDNYLGVGQRRASNAASTCGIYRGNETGETSYDIRDTKAMLDFQRAITGYQVVCDTTVAWALNSSGKLLRGRGKLQIWHWKPLTPDQPGRRDSLASIQPSPSLMSNSSNTSNATVEKILRGRDRTGISVHENSGTDATIGASTPPLPVIVIYTQEKAEFTYIHMELEIGHQIVPTACDCNRNSRTCRRSVIEKRSGSSDMPFIVRRMSVKSESLQDWDLSVFAQPRHPLYNDTKRVPQMKCRYLNLDFESVSDREDFALRLKRALDLRNAAEAEFRAICSKSVYLSDRVNASSKSGPDMNTRRSSASSMTSNLPTTRPLPSSPPRLSPISRFSGLNIEMPENSVPNSPGRDSSLTVFQPSTRSDLNESLAPRLIQSNRAEKLSGVTGISSDTSLHESTFSRTSVPTSTDYMNDNSDEDIESFETETKYKDAVQEPRLLDPDAYFNDLARLENIILRKSSVWIHGKASRREISESEVDQCRIKPIPGSTLDSNPRSTFHEAIHRLAKDRRSDILINFLESQNIIYRSLTNIATLQQRGFCGEFFSILVEQDVQERIGIVELKQIMVNDVRNISAEFDHVSRSIQSSIDSRMLPSGRSFSFNARIEELSQRLTTSCSRFLRSLGLDPENIAEPAQIWQSAVQIIDLAVVSYAGAHVERFDYKTLSASDDESGFSIPNLPISFMGVEPQPQLPHSRRDRLQSFFRPSSSQSSTRSDQSFQIPVETFNFRRRRLQCLDSLLGTRAWVFHNGRSSTGDERLCLSTDIKTISDIWGPCWQIVLKPGSNRIDRYEIGNGSLIPWAQPEESRFRLRPGEVYCHWMANNKWSSIDVKEHQKGLDRVYFTGQERLLIGAVNSGLQVNNGCNLSPEELREIKTKLNEKGALRIPGSDRPRRYLDSVAVQVQASALSFVQAAGQLTYKRRAGQNMKGALVERWRNTRNRNPAELEALCGIEISVCTQNARRRSLLHLMNTKCIKTFLDAVCFDWESDECRDTFFDSLEDRNKFKAFWNKHRDWRRSAGDAITLSLETLESTGVDADNGELCAFWAETFESSTEPKDPQMEEWIVTLSRKEHTWTRFLKDTPDSMTMAVMESICLDFTNSATWGHRCRHTISQNQRPSPSLQPPFLETAILINEKMVVSLLDKGHIRKVRTERESFSIWDTSGLKPKTKFSLGEHGVLSVIAQSTCWSPIIMKWVPIASQTFYDMRNHGIRGNVGARIEKHHQEYIRGAWDCQPLLVLIVSESPA